MVLCRSLFYGSDKSWVSDVFFLMFYFENVPLTSTSVLPPVQPFLSKDSRSLSWTRWTVMRPIRTIHLSNMQVQICCQLWKRCGCYYLSPQACGNVLQDNFARLELIKVFFPFVPSRGPEKFCENVKLEIRRCISLIRVEHISPCYTILHVLKDESSYVPLELN